VSEGKKLRKPIFFRQMEWLSNNLVEVWQLTRRWPYRGLRKSTPALQRALAAHFLHGQQPRACRRRESWGARPHSRSS